jgi:alpha-1,6-mannosyltransferase
MAIHLVDCTMFWSPRSGGNRRYLREKQRWLQAREHWRHTVLVPGTGGEGVVGCGGLPLPASGGYRLPLRRGAAARLLERLEPDLIESGDPYRLAWSVLDAAARCRVPALAFCHSNLMLLAARFAQVSGLSRAAPAACKTASRYLKRLYSRFDLVLAPSQWMRGELVDLGLTQVRYQPLGVDSETFNPRNRDGAARRALGLPEDRRLLLYLGRFGAEKKLQTLAGAVRRLGSGYLLLAVGAGPAPPRGPQVRVMQWEADRARLSRLLANVDGFVHAGDQETFGLSVLEAMASGTPVVVRRSAGLAELVDGDCGLGVCSDGASAWAEAIEAAFDHDRDRRIERALARAQAPDWDKVLPGLEAHYLDLLGSRRACTARAS